MKTLIMVVLSIALLAGGAYAADFSTWTTDELLGLRGTMYNSSVETRTALHSELTKRVETMTAEQKAEFASRPAKAGTGKGRGMGRGMGKGMANCPNVPDCPYRTN
ncbi:MAG: DUF1104 domain-containing protein [Candidatus Magnetominusculus sp. LBB02]|nr:DUF1104 domain-containing protein [Candidatus Magnetominusculus sp. LBB02]